MGDNAAHEPRRPLATKIRQQDQRYRASSRVTLAGAAVNIFLAILKIVFGIIGQSQALVADGVHSLSDLASDAVVLFAAREGSRDADEEHPYGHARFETAATVGLGILLTAVAAGIVFDAARRLLAPEQLLQPGLVALIVAAVSVLAKECLYHYTARTAEKIRSNLLRANAWHHRSDAVSSIIVIVGVGGTMAGFPYLDAVAAIAVALMIAKIGWDLGWQSIRELVDTALDRERVAEIRRTIATVDGVQALHMLRSRRMGENALVDVHIQVDPTLSVSEGHQISETVRSRLIHEIDEVSDVMVHIDPEDDETSMVSGTLPLRQAVEARLRQYFQDIEPAQRIEKLVLHYLNGKIRVELLLPLDVLSNKDAAAELSKRFNRAVAHDAQISGVQLRFH